MKVISYPVLLYSLGKTGKVGICVGTSLVVSGKDTEFILKKTQRLLTRKYKKDRYYDDFPIEQPKIKAFPLYIRPFHQLGTKQYLEKRAIPIRLMAVYGKTGSNIYGCYFPEINDYLTYDDPSQLESLVDYFFSYLLRRYPIPALYKFAQAPKPEVEYVKLRVREENTRLYQTAFDAEDPPIINKLTVPVKGSSTTQRKDRLFPDTAWEREDLVQRVADAISKDKANLLLIGEPGIGKSIILRSAIRQIRAQTKKSDNPQRFYALLPQQITAGYKYLGQWQEGLTELIEALEVRNGILWIQDFVHLLTVGGWTPSESVAAFMIPFIEEQQLRIIGEIHPAAYERMQVLLPGFTRMLNTLNVPPLPESATYKVLYRYSDFAEQKFSIHLEKEAIGEVYRLQKRYFPYEQFPGKAIRFLGSLLEKYIKTEDKTIRTSGVTEHFSKISGLPLQLINDQLLLEKETVNDFFKQRVIGQEPAIEHLTSLIKIFKVGLNDPTKPIGTLLFIGPTGVGKTQSAKALSEFFFSIGQITPPLIRLDMSNFQDPFSINQILGRGNEVSSFIKSVRENPFSVILLDEIEKANPVVFDFLMNLLDEGRLTDGFGRQTDFKNTIIILTSNIGSGDKPAIGFGTGDSDEARYTKALQRVFRPEFLNRIDRVIYFRPLEKAAIYAIAKKELASLHKREGIKNRKITLRFSESIENQVVKKGYDIKYGVRPLQRTIEEEVVFPLSKWLFKQEAITGAELSIDFIDGKIEISRVDRI